MKNKIFKSKCKKELYYSNDLAEIIGIMIGDGGLYLNKQNKYQTSIAFSKKETQYMFYVKNIFENYFENYHFYISEIENEFLLKNISVFIGKKFIEFGLKSGNKTKNKIIVPSWILSNKNYMKRFLRGIFDTDGSVYKKYGIYAQIEIKWLVKKQCFR